MTVMPVSAVGLLFERYGGAVALLIVDPDREARPDARALEAGLGLTRAEAEIGIFLVAGRRPPEIARLRGVSVQTVRSQLKTIYAKVGATSRADVVRILLQGTIALPRKDPD